MDDPGRRDHRPADRLRTRSAMVAGLLALGLVFGVAPTVGDGLNRQAQITSAPAVGTVAATTAQVAGANFSQNGAAIAAVKKKSKKKTKARLKRVTIESRITDSDSPILTEEGKGNYVRLVCPGGAVAVSGGMLTGYINLVMSASGPNHPLTGAYTPRTWWVTASNANIDGQGGTLPWRGVVNCMSPVKIKR